MNQSASTELARIEELLDRQPWAATYRLIDFTRQALANPKAEAKAIQLKLAFDRAELDEDREKLIGEAKTWLKELALVDLSVTDRQAWEQNLALKAYRNQRPSELVLKAQGLGKSYSNTGFKLYIDELELRLGEVTGLLGENTTGKTTLFRILAGDLAMDQGTLSYPLFQTGKKLDWIQLKKQISYVPQHLGDWQGSLTDILSQEATLHGLKGSANTQALRYIVQRLGLATHLEKSWRQLSGGYKLRFALARALVWRPKLLILDEPLAFLDIRAQITVLNDLQQMAKNHHHPMAVLMSSQHVHEVERIADQMLFMRGGQLVHRGQRSTIGTEREFQIFEFACPLSLVALTERLGSFRYQSLYFTGQAYVMRTTRTVQPEELLRTLLDRGISVTYFRDISQSLKPHFYENLA